MSKVFPQKSMDIDILFIKFAVYIDCAVRAEQSLTEGTLAFTKTWTAF